MFEPTEKEPVICPDCNGYGAIKSAYGFLGEEPFECETCGGSGEVTAFHAVRIRANRIALIADDRQNERKTL